MKEIDEMKEVIVDTIEDRTIMVTGEGKFYQGTKRLTPFEVLQVLEKSRSVLNKCYDLIYIIERKSE